MSGAYEANGLVFVSGQIHVNEKMELCGETIEEKFEIALSNVNKILAETDLTLNDIIRVQLYMTNLNELPSINTIYGNHFKHPYPTRTAIEVSALPLGANLEIDVIATRN
ncbi:RidA family protein [Patescibacteria group bacterium]|nr:RidA family protein [Patescibacteria group bacterium]MBU1890991.1 RidA family protein [Patescibacteria group bacterium]